MQQLSPLSGVCLFNYMSWNNRDKSMTYKQNESLYFIVLSCKILSHTPLTFQ